jgi:hypothetical protein
MAISGGPDIVEDGLLLCLDAADKNSYPGNGTTFYDITGNGSHASLINGIAYDSSNLGGVLMDGGNEYLDISPTGSYYNHMSSGDFAVETFVRSDNVVYPMSRHPLKLCHTTYNSNYKGWSVGHRGSSSSIEVRVSDGAYFSTTTLNHPTISESTYYHRIFCVSRNNGCSTTYYLNGDLVGTANATTVTGAICDKDQSSDYGSAGLVFGMVWGWRYIGSINIIRVYDYALSASEVLQNYNATKGRYGL